MSQNFRASYTETLGKLETQYCKLMVSVLRVRFERRLPLQVCPGHAGRASLLCWGGWGNRSSSKQERGAVSLCPRLSTCSQSSCMGRFVLLRKPRASD